VVISVDDIKDAMKKITDAGGKFLANLLKFPASGNMFPSLTRREIV